MNKPTTCVSIRRALRKMTLIVILALTTQAIVGCNRSEQSGAAATNPRTRGDLRALYDKLAIGDRIEFADSVLGSPDRVSTSTILSLDCTKYVYTDLLSGKTIVLHFSLGGRLLFKSFEMKPLISIH